MIGVLSYYAIDFVSASWSVKEISTEPGGLSIRLHPKIIYFFISASSRFSRNKGAI